MIYEEETALIRGGLFEVQNEVGLGHHEEIYHKAMTLWLDQQNISYMSKAAHPLLLEDCTAHTFYPDLIVWNKLRKKRGTDQRTFYLGMICGTALPSGVNLHKKRKKHEKK